MNPNCENSARSFAVNHKLKGQPLRQFMFVIAFGLLSLMGSARAFGAADVIHGKLVSVTQSGTHGFYYTYALVVSNGVPALNSATITASTRSREIQIIQGQVSLGPVAANSQFVTNGTIVIQVEERDDDYFEELRFLVVPGPGSVAEAQIDGATGGTITVNDPGDPLSGTQITFPPGALSDASDTITIGYSTSLPAPLPPDAIAAGLVPASVVLTVSRTGSSPFLIPITVKMPYSTKVAPTDFPSVIYLEPSLNDYEPVQVASVDQAGGFVTFNTKHFTNFVTVIVNGLVNALTGVTPLAPLPAIDTLFRPNIDGFEAQNISSAFELGSRGACYGLTSFAGWYYKTQPAGGVRLYSKFATAPDSPPHIPQEDATAREIFQEAFVDTHGDNVASIPKQGQTPAPLLVAVQFIQSMLATHSPQLATLGVTEDQGPWHSVLVYSWDPSSGSFGVYDPNAPGIPRSFVWSVFTENFGKFDSGSNSYSIFAYDAYGTHYDNQTLLSVFKSASGDTPFSTFFSTGWHFNTISFSSQLGTQYPGDSSGPTIPVNPQTGTALSVTWKCQSCLPGTYTVNLYQDNTLLISQPISNGGVVQFTTKPFSGSSAELFAYVSTGNFISLGYAGYQRVELCGDGACWDFVRDFSAATNPNGVWSYLGNGVLLTQHGSAAVGGSPNWWNGLSQPNSVFIGATTAFTIAPSNYYTIDPQSNTASVAFNSPGSGNYLVSGSFIGAYATVNPHPVTITVNGTVIWSSTVSTPLGVSPFSTTLSLMSGDVVSFNVLTGSTGCTYCYLGTGLSASISKQLRNTTSVVVALNVPGTRPLKFGGGAGFCGSGLRDCNPAERDANSPPRTSLRWPRNGFWASAEERVVQFP